MKTYPIWSDYDPNDVFEVEANSEEEAAFIALESLGWVVGQGYENDAD